MVLDKLNRWLDRQDPYWYSRLMSLKLSYISVILFGANLLFHPPMASLIMLIAGAGILLIEMPTINKSAKKDNLYLGYILLICLTIGLFASYVYLKAWFIMVAAGWCYILYYALRNKPELFASVSVILMLGLMPLEALKSGNVYLIFNLLLFILQFALIVFWAHKLFPNRYHLIWLSASLRTLEGLRLMLHEDSLAASPQVFKHNQAARNVLGLLTGKPYLRQAVAVSNYLDYYHYYISDLIAKQRISAPELALIAADLLQLERAMRWPRAMRWQPQDVSLNPPIVLANDLNLARHYELCTKLYFTWNRLCAHANS